MKMKKLIILVMAIALCGCSTMADLLGETPLEVRQNLYDIGYYMGQSYADQSPDKIEDMVKMAEKAKMVHDPAALAATLFLDAVRVNEEDRAIMYAMIRSVLKDIGVRITDGYQSVDFDPELWVWFIDSFLLGVEART
jgi:hypothetical protein